ncbi:MAG: hypothetical protein EU529_00980 [Promethearchaeota archaeon]|nr:MAG: hypothetical protein EU529_00980 [Candidatus Lokiarchaeota archaeon]
MTRAERAQKLRNQTIAATIGRLFQMSVDIFGLDIKSLDKVGKREGQEVELYFEALDTYITLTLSKSRLIPHMGPSDNSVATVILTSEKENLIPDIIKMMRMKNNLSGLMKVIFGHVLKHKIKIKGSLGAAIKIIKLLSIGTHPSFKKE